jgi:hypothetical protein
VVNAALAAGAPAGGGVFAAGTGAVWIVAAGIAAAGGFTAGVAGAGLVHAGVDEGEFTVGFRAAFAVFLLIFIFMLIYSMGGANDRPPVFPQADFFPHYCCRSIVRPSLNGQRAATSTKRHIWAKSRDAGKKVKICKRGA